MTDTIALVADAFGIPPVRISTLGEGLIHKTYKIESKTKALVLQEINTLAFEHPQIIIDNYRILYEELSNRNFKVPEPISDTKGKWLVYDHLGKPWRALEYIANSYTTRGLTGANAYSASRCFAAFIQALSGLSAERITPTIPNFHNLSFRISQLLSAKQQALSERLSQAQPLLKQAESSMTLLDFYTRITTEGAFKRRIMHHDCKLSNLLFDHHTNLPLCPIDLDTTMPGYYFSDFGDMVRSMAATANESSIAWNELDIDEEIYAALLEGYLSGIQGVFSDSELKHIHHSGLLMIFMQAIRFLTDYLHNDRYYRIQYPDQNLNRAKNQFILLKRLEGFLVRKYGYRM